MKEILIVIDNLQGGGAEKVLYEILKNLDKKNFKIHLLLIENKGVYIEKIKQIGVDIDYIFNERRDFFKNIIYRKFKSFILKNFKIFYCIFPRFIKSINKKKYDVEIAFLEGYSTLLVSRRKTVAKKIAWIHTDLKQHRILNKLIEINSYLKINKIVCVSKEAKVSLEDLYPVLKNKIEIIYNFVDKQEIIYKANIEKRRLYKKEINIIAIGRLTKVKGFDILLEAHNRILKSGIKNYDLYILGEGHEREKYEKYIKQECIADNTFLLGFKENPYPYLKQASIFILPSRYEGYSLVVAEALCLGKPIIATSCVGPKELLKNGEYGILVEVENISELSEQMKKLIFSKEVRENYSKLSEERSQIFESKKIIKKIEDLLI